VLVWGIAVIELSVSAMLPLPVLCRIESMGSTAVGPSRSLRHGSLLLAVRRVIAIVIVVDLGAASPHVVYFLFGLSITGGKKKKQRSFSHSK
jgi:hypothetical protein